MPCYRRAKRQVQRANRVIIRFCIILQRIGFVVCNQCVVAGAFATLQLNMIGSGLKRAWSVQQMIRCGHVRPVADEELGCTVFIIYTHTVVVAHSKCRIGYKIQCQCTITRKDYLMRDHCVGVTQTSSKCTNRLSKSTG